MITSGFYPDPFDKAFARSHDGKQWTHIISDSRGNLRTDDEISNTALLDASPPNNNDLLVGQPLRWAVAGANRLPHSFQLENEDKKSQFLVTPGLYPDPFDNAFARYHNGEQWTYISSGSDGNLRTDYEISNTALVDAKQPNKVDLLVGQPLRWAVAGVNRLPHSFGLEVSETSTSKGNWVQGFTSRVRLTSDSIEILVEVSKKRSTRFLSSFEEQFNEGLRTIPLRTIQAVHLSPAKRGIMGALQFTVPGSLTNQHRDSAGKALRVLKMFGDGPDLSTTQSHENSVTFELSQQRNFEKFHAEVLMRLGSIDSGTVSQVSPSSDLTNQLRELKSLLDDGILTQEEFDSAKQEILKKL